jgi:DNA-binding phage protein
MDDLTVFDVSQYLDSKEAIAEYLNQVLEDGDSNELIANSKILYLKILAKIIN